MISDNDVRRLQDILHEPDLSGTRYRIIGQAGQGGMGTVFEAEDKVLKRLVALKVIQPAEAFLDENAAARLLNEAQILARLEHPGIVPVHDAGTLADGSVFYTMKLVKGQRLDQHAKTASRSDLLRMFQKICDAVAFAHSHDVVHRDLKPENIMVGPFGEVLVLDWGVAKALGTPHESAGTVIGTAAYMAPEQARGEVDRIDRRADIFALGGILQFLLSTGRLPRPLRAVVSKARADAPSRRFSSATELSEEVGRFMDGEPLDTYRENLLERATRLVANNPMAFALVAAYLAMRILVFLFLRR